MPIKVTKPAVNLYEEITDLKQPFPVQGSVSANEKTRSVLGLDNHEQLTIGTDGVVDNFTSTGIDDNATSTKVTVSDTGIDVTGTVTADGLTVDGNPAYYRADNASQYVAQTFFPSGTLSDSNVGFGTGQKSGENKYTVYTWNGTAAKDRLKIDNNGDISFYEATGNTPKLVWKAGDERLGIGTSNPSQQLELLSASPAVKLRSSGTNGGILIFNVNGTDKGYIGSSYHLLSGGSSNDTTIRANGELQIATGGATERMRIDSSGNLLLNGASSGTSGGGTWFENPNNSTMPTYLRFKKTYSGAREAMDFRYSGTQVGRILFDNTSTSYNTSSDYRLKTDVQPMTGATERLKALNPVNFAWKTDGSRVDGFLAHEAAEVVPEAVTGIKDAMRTEEYEVTPAVEATYDDEGNELTAAVEAVMGTREVIDPQAIDQSKLVPLLTAALQEAVAKIESLETRIAALESN